jgi:hypothetical protein
MDRLDLRVRNLIHTVERDRRTSLEEEVRREFTEAWIKGVTSPEALDILLTRFEAKLSSRWRRAWSRLCPGFVSNRCIELRAEERAPGSRLLHLVDIVSVVLSPKAARSLRESILDLQLEHREALAAERPGEATWVRWYGYWSFWKTVATLLPVSSIRLVVRLWKLDGGG